jgi:hypothetical protein
MCVAAFAVVGKIALSEDIDVRSLQQKLAAQEARLNDLQAKVNAGAYASGSEVEGILSANKNAVLTIGGTVNTRYYYRDGKTSGGDVDYTNLSGATLGNPAINNGNTFNYDDTGLVNATGNTSIANSGANIAANGIFSVAQNDVVGIGSIFEMRDVDGDLIGPGVRYYGDGTEVNYRQAANWGYRLPAGINRSRAAQGDLKVSDAKLTVKIDVNDYFDAFLKIDLQSSVGEQYSSDNAEAYWVRWKNVCNSGFGLKVGRDALVFGEGVGTGVLGDWTAGAGDGLSDLAWDGFAAELARPLHNGWDIGRITQITPYWESQDGKFGFEVSLFQNANKDWGRMNLGSPKTTYFDGNKWKSTNYGLGSASARIRFRPVEGLLLSASVVNWHDKSANKFGGTYDTNKKDNTAVDLAFSYRPAFFNKLNIWGEWLHGWDVGNIKGIDSDAVNLGFSLDLNESWTVFVQGDYLNSRGYGKAVNFIALDDANDNVLIPEDSILGYGYGYDKAKAWAAYAGLQYKLPYGVSLEAGWKYEEIKWSGNRLNRAADYKVKTAKLKGHTVYAHLGFDF